MKNKKNRSTTAHDVKATIASNRWTETEHKTQAARPVGAGAGPRRGDRRDMNKVYTGTQKHAARGNTPRANVATRKD